MFLCIEPKLDHRLAFKMSNETDKPNLGLIRCLMAFPCTCCCGVMMYDNLLTNPTDAKRLYFQDEKVYLDQMQGKGP